MTEIREACPFCGGERIMRAKGGGRMSYDGFGDTNFRCGWLEAENAKLRELVRDICGMACFECNPWADGFACAHWDGECRIRERMAALGIEV